MGFPLYGATGVTHWDQERAFSGVTVYTTFGGERVHLIDMNGNVVHEWTPPQPAKPYYGFLRENGNLSLRCYNNDEPWQHGGFGGTIVELDWDGNVVWRYDNPVIHHDHCILRNGNTLVIGWEALSPEMAAKVRGGVTPQGDGSATSEMLGDFLLEVTPDHRVAWEWHGHEKLDPAVDVICPLDARREWTHCNGVAELADGNIALSFRQTSEVIFIDKATGDVYWRFGPGVLSHQHHPSQLPNGNLLVFDNGEHRVGGGAFSRVVEIDPNTKEIAWQFRADPSLSFFSTGISSAQRLPNGNTFICDGRTGRLFEVTTAGDVVWEFMNPEVVPWRGEQRNRAVFRAHRYATDSPQIQGRV